jgi:adenylate cyclase
MTVMTRPWSLDKLAAVSGEPAAGLQRLADAGMLHRGQDGDFEPDSLHRVRLIQFARSCGVDDEQLAAAASQQGDLLGIFEELHPASNATVNLSDTARQLGFDGGLIDELADLLDWDDVAAGTEADVSGLRMLARALELGMPPDALMQVVRVLVDGTDRLADGVVRTFHDYVHERFRTQGLMGRELLDATQRVGRPLVDLVEPSVVYFLRRAYQRANREDMLRHLAEDATPPPHTPGEEQCSVLFVDLASFTPLTATMGDHTAADVLRRFGVNVRTNATRFRGRILKQIGDAFMVMFTQPANVIEFGLAMDEFVDGEPQFPALHIGAHHGTVLYRDGDYVGATVNLAARVASTGSAGQFLITDDLRKMVLDIAGADFVDLPPRRLKGIADPIRLIEVRRHRPARADRETDPVCGLLLDPDDVTTRVTWNDMSFAFCCNICRQAFVENPSRFVDA